MQTRRNFILAAAAFSIVPTSTALDETRSGLAARSLKASPMKVLIVEDKLYVFNGHNECLTSPEELPVLLKHLRRNGDGYGVTVLDDKPWVKVTAWFSCSPG